MATQKQQKAFKNLAENGGNKRKAFKDAGYSQVVADNPKKVTESKGWEELMDTYLPDDLLAQKHNELLNATDIGHMVFPSAVKDKEIRALLKTVNCTVKKIQHGEQANHVWFWARNNRALKDGLDLAYKLKGKYAPEKKKVEFGNMSDDELNEKITEELFELID